MTNFLRETTQPIIFVSFKHNFESFQGVPKVVLEKIKNNIPLIKDTNVRFILNFCKP